MIILGVMFSLMCMAINQTVAATFCQTFMAANQIAATQTLPHFSHQPNSLFLPQNVDCHNVASC